VDKIVAGAAALMVVMMMMMMMMLMLMLMKELDGKIGNLVIELQKKKRSLEQEHTETQMVQVSESVLFIH